MLHKARKEKCRRFLRAGSARPESMLGVAVRALDDGHRLAVRELTFALAHWLAAVLADAFGAALLAPDTLVAVLLATVGTVPCHW